MNTEQIKRLEKLLDRELSGEEAGRLGRIQSILDIQDHDSLWAILAAMEYQRTYYEELPQKIAAASTEILQGISVAAEKEMGRAQSLLAESVAEQARKMSLRLNVETLLPLGVLALVCLLAYGSLLLWAGYCLGTGYVQDMTLILRVPSGFLMSALCLAGSLFLGVHAGREFAVEGKGWRKKTMVALAMLVLGGFVVSQAL
jgi:hypothetical protein